FAPHSRYSYVNEADIKTINDLEILAASDDAGVYLVASKDCREVYITGHPEYDTDTLKGEYERDLLKGIAIDPPKNYFPGDDTSKPPKSIWRSHAHLLYSNWINHCIYQNTPYNIDEIGKRK
ncbi:homoserine O-succinyltransferase, partial [Eubacteriales bacterium OttesenSCG-928-G02]|nr:homoserine O-succinyltransferase [Eubacteriales bacterium OttesenSCG-928-G02]